MACKKIVVIGGGHNGLVAAAYLAKAGHEVTVLESRANVGGAASTDTTTFPGYKISSASYLNSLFLPEIVRELDLRRFGYEVLCRNPSSFTPLADGKSSLFLGPDMEFNKREIAKFSAKDAEAYPRYEHQLGEIADWMASVMTMTPPNIPPRNIGDVKNLLQFMRHIFRLNPVQMFRMAKLLLSDPVKYLDGWFESDVLKATLLTDALIGATELSGYVLLHHVMGEAGGARGVWGYMRGGMGGISNSIALSCRELGVSIISCAEAQRITLAEGHHVSGVVAKVVGHNGWNFPTRRLFKADIVVSAINPTHTFEKLLASSSIVDDVRKNVAARNTKSASMKVNLTLSALPNFRAMPGTIPGPQHQGTIHIAPTVSYILEALRLYQEGKYHFARPILELTIPSVVDNTLAPPGAHVMNIFLQFFPYDRNYSGTGSQEPYFQDVVMPILREYISNIDEIVTGVQVLAPQDLERMFGMVGGNIFHGGMGLSQLFSLRPIRGMADYRTPIQGLYLSGAGTHPGGGVTGACGYNAAREILSDIDSNTNSS